MVPPTSSSHRPTSLEAAKERVAGQTAGSVTAGGSRRRLPCPGGWVGRTFGGDGIGQSGSPRIVVCVDGSADSRAAEEMLVDPAEGADLPVVGSHGTRRGPSWSYTRNGRHPTCRSGGRSPPSPTTEQPFTGGPTATR